MQPLISIIIPAYNVEKYIAECLESVVKQDNGKIEIVLVNDGSTDGTDIICRKYSESYEMIRYFVKENGGLSDARNFGIHNARGEYLNFLDSDDYLPDNAIAILCDRIAKTHSQIYFGLYTNLFTDGSLSKCDYSLDEQKVSGLKGESLLDYLITGRIYGWFSCLLTVKCDYIVSNSFYFDKGVTFEDTRWTPLVLINAENVQYIDASLYVYRRNRAGSITATFSESSFYNKLDVFAYTEEFCKKYDLSKESRKKMFINLANLYVSTIYDARYFSVKERRAAYDVLRKYKFILAGSSRKYHKLINVFWSVFGLNVTSFVLYLRAEYVRQRQKN